jgi:hypothetical protein
LIKKRYVWFLITGFLLWCSLSSSRLVYAQQDTAAGAIASAKQQIVVCYGAAAEAERAGGNVTVLAVALDEAGVLLSKAELAYSMGDFGAASGFAVQCRERLSGFVAEAAGLKAAGELMRDNDFLFNVVGSTVGTFVVVLVGIRVWFFLKRRYGREELATEVPRV